MCLNRHRAPSRRSVSGPPPFDPPRFDPVPARVFCLNRAKVFGLFPVYQNGRVGEIGKLWMGRAETGSFHARRSIGEIE